MTSVDPYIKFGKFILNKQQLEKNNLQVKYPSKSPHPIFTKKVKITDDSKDLIFDILHTHKINIQTQKELSTEEADIFFKLLSSCGIDKYLNYKPISKDVSDYIHRFNLLRGAIIAGNHSEETLEEIRDVIKLLSNRSINKISLEDANDILDYIDIIDKQAYRKQNNI